MFGGTVLKSFCVPPMPHSGSSSPVIKSIFKIYNSCGGI